MNPHATHIDKWLKANELSPSKVRWESYPIGMVQRWIERAEAAESQIVALQEQVKALQDALDTAKIVLVDSDHGSSRGGFTFSERRYRALLKLDAALSQVPAQKEQDNG